MGSLAVTAAMFGMLWWLEDLPLLSEEFLVCTRAKETKSKLIVPFGPGFPFHTYLIIVN